MRTIWKGALHFGQVVIPVGLAITHAKGKVAFKRLHAECRTPVREKRWCPFHERVVEDSELVRGYEIAPGEYVVVDEPEYAAIAPDSDRAIRIAAFVAPDELDPVDLEGAYYLAPGDHPAALRTYALLCDAMRHEAAVALVRFTAWGTERIATVAPHDSGRVLLLRGLAYPEDRVSAAAIVDELTAITVPKPELELARQLIDRLRKPAGKVDLADHHRERVAALVAGREVVHPEGDTARDAAPTLDLEQALRKSLRAAPRRRRRTAPAR